MTCWKYCSMLLQAGLYLSGVHRVSENWNRLALCIASRQSASTGRYYRYSADQRWNFRISSSENDCPQRALCLISWWTQCLFPRSSESFLFSYSRKKNRRISPPGRQHCRWCRKPNSGLCHCQNHVFCPDQPNVPRSDEGWCKTVDQVGTAQSASPMGHWLHYPAAWPSFFCFFQNRRAFLYTKIMAYAQWCPDRIRCR